MKIHLLFLVTVFGCGPSVCPCPLPVEAPDASPEACVPHTDAEWCRVVGADCGSWHGVDNCGQPRDVANCGECVLPETCGGNGDVGACGVKP
jgi:hypothetical protein